MNSDTAVSILIAVVACLSLIMIGVAITAPTHRDVCEEYFDERYKIAMCVEMRKNKMTMKDIVNSPIILEMTRDAR